MLRILLSLLTKSDWKSLSKDTKIGVIFIYVGFILTFLIISRVPYGMLGIVGNLVLFGLSGAYLMKYQRAKPFKSDFLDEITMPPLIIVSFLTTGSIYSIYLIYKFHRNPVRVPYTDDEIRQNITKTRERKLNKIGIR
jgi:hypothetical protein